MNIEMATIGTSEKNWTLEAVASTKRLPSLPSVAMRMLEIAQQEEPDYRELCQIIRSDPAISGRILKTVNSSLFALRPKIKSIEDAVPRLGISTIRTLILSFHLSRWKAGSGDMQGTFKRIWRSCLTQAVIAELLAKKVKLDPPACFTGGMLQDIGILAMITEIGDEYLSNVIESDEQTDLIALEKERFGFTHVDVSAEIMRRWNMGDVFADAIELHHQRTGNVQSSTRNDFAVVLQAASLGAAVLETGKRSKVDDAVTEWMRFLNCHFGFNPGDANEVISEIEERVREHSVVFNFDISDSSTSSEHVVERAKELLQDIALESQLKMAALQQSKSSKPTDDAIYRDYLSGLYNRRFLAECLKPNLDAWVKKRKPIAMLYLDVDKFKTINDSYGHKAGDAAIKHVADWLRKCTRGDDYVFRIGGDEFLVVMQIKEKHYKTVAGRLVSDLPDLECSSGNIPMSLSIGGVFYLPKRGDLEFDPQLLIDQADTRMYVAKNTGGNCVSLT